jgi:23S rRNA pseudouridine1911/1915/1917 synthase
MYQQQQPYYFMNTDVKTPFNILFEDNHLMIVLKPHGVVSEADEYHDIALDTKLRDFIKKRDQKPGNVYLKAVHRLDKPATGLVIFAKTSKALERMHKMMQDKQIEKTYLACLEKAPSFDSGHLVHYLTHKLHKAEVTNEKIGKKSELDYKVIEKQPSWTWVEVKLITGRYHQIRAQFATIGSPILGDTRYGANTHLNDEAIALVNIRVSFLHPVTKLPVMVEHPDAHARLSVFLDKLLQRQQGRSSQLRTP